MINAINKKLILPPEFFWFEIDEYNKDEDDDEEEEEEDNTNMTIKVKKIKILFLI